MQPNITKKQRRIIGYLSLLGEAKRRELVMISDIPRSTVYDNLKKLRKRGVVKSYEKNPVKQGRPPVYWCLTDKFKSRI